MQRDGIPNNIIKRMEKVTAIKGKSAQPQKEGEMAEIKEYNASCILGL
jgi:hypothetical protein